MRANIQQPKRYTPCSQEERTHRRHSGRVCAVEGRRQAQVNAAQHCGRARLHRHLLGAARGTSQRSAQRRMRLSVIPFASASTHFNDSAWVSLLVLLDLAPVKPASATPPQRIIPRGPEHPLRPPHPTPTVAAAHEQRRTPEVSCHASSCLCV